ncbi:hypothetical protein ACI2L4_10085 [Streptomyces sparsogenes]|uniref:hypothetical protein n=1 Tax=Streptomyces sparsogenes TaxID=67365 RepID=UPI00384FB96B
MLDEKQSESAGGKPWWRGSAIAGGVFLVLAVVGLLLNLSGGSNRDPDSPIDRSSSDQAPTVPAEQPEAGGDPRSTGKRMINGVPVGYSHSEAGAVQAAVNYQVARSSAKYFTDQTVRHKILETMMTAKTLDDQIRNDDTGMKQILGSLGITSDNEDQLVARGAAMGTQVTTYTNQVATVKVWIAGLIGTTDTNAPMPVSASWTTYTLTLLWQSGDWKLSSVDSASGPTPLNIGGDDPSSVEEFRTADREFNAPPYTG